MRWISSSANFVTALPKIHRKALAFLAVLLLIALLLPSSNSSVSTPLSLDHLIDTDAPLFETPTLSIRQLKAPWAFDSVPENETLLVPAAGLRNSYQYIVRKGDTLSSIFERLQLPQKTMYQLLEADLNVLALDNLKPGHTLVFEKQDQLLQRLELQFSLAHKVVYQRKEGDGFEFNEVQLEGDWKQQLISGEILYSFTGSGKQAGLSQWEAQTITELLKQRVDFRRDIQRGDKFEVLLSRQYVDNEATGDNKIEAIRIKNRRHEINAFLFEDNYYDEKGRNLEKAFQRYPFNGKYRLSSSFNPKRRHPITGLIRPHNGTDFAMGVGSPVVSIGDGIVSRVVRHKYAGLYIEIQHGQSYKTRYLHLSKSYVVKGQRVKRGERIAKSGNTGRSTGAHLHFELHVNGRPVNAMTAKIPIAVSLQGKKKEAFQRQLKDYLARIETAQNQQVAQAKQNAQKAESTL
ncbi:peptidoglycan DD-metalloendopeptidase family protein [Neptuniibacter sp. 1_MG-2023]|uniref:peptidoglycan DD-metalloendopeptidase family protein n=1 Tax=Neptuniibacter sp. 1_MG-2023 TaxID=3062662 RepID=UPI0026E3C962|nr:peptidoglycan DD-metalloendopeptidase family protein [Neptuniibacter sp. 1_MG-2023]MDO6594559.1 peptidoglycan DD-metalloendopeptidase family protein [Neptuniibacter sp. 1_MG-2023]